MAAEPNTQSSQLSEFAPDPGGAPAADANTLLVAAYGLFWLILFGFIAATWRKQTALSQRLSRVEQSLTGKS